MNDACQHLEMKMKFSSARSKIINNCFGHFNGLLNPKYLRWTIFVHTFAMRCLINKISIWIPNLDDVVEKHFTLCDKCAIYGIKKIHFHLV